MSRPSRDALDVNPWRVLESKYIYEDQWLALRSDKVRLPNGQELEPYHTVECADWVTVVALTPERNVVLVEEYRHGAKRVMVEFPSGTKEGGFGAKAVTEDELHAVKRELLEETGYSGTDWHHLGSCPVSASRLSNQLHCFLMLNATKVAPPRLERGEIIAVSERSWKDFLADVHAGKVELQTPLYTCLYLMQVYVMHSSAPELADRTIWPFS